MDMVVSSAERVALPAGWCWRSFSTTVELYDGDIRLAGWAKPYAPNVEWSNQIHEDIKQIIADYERSPNFDPEKELVLLRLIPCACSGPIDEEGEFVTNQCSRCMRMQRVYELINERKKRGLKTNNSQGDQKDSG